MDEISPSVIVILFWLIELPQLLNQTIILIHLIKALGNQFLFLGALRIIQTSSNSSKRVHMHSISNFKEGGGGIQTTQLPTQSHPKPRKHSRKLCAWTSLSGVIFSMKHLNKFLDKTSIHGNKTYKWFDLKRCDPLLRSWQHGEKLRPLKWILPGKLPVRLDSSDSATRHLFGFNE